MKKIYLAITFIALAVMAEAQAPQLAPDKQKALPMPLIQMTGNEVVPMTPANNRPTGEIDVTNANRMTIVTALAGITEYDLQSNASVQNRLALTPDGELSAGWTMSFEPDAFADRGTGYNWWDGSNWGETPLERLESVRTGWPSIFHTTDYEYSVTHESGEIITMVRRDIGSGSWTESQIPSPAQGNLWPRACAGGADNNSVHMICVATPVANGGVEYEGQDGALMYFRSQDQGDTWDVQGMTFAATDTSQFLAFDGDSYAIHARGNTIAFAVFHDFADTFVMVSEDNGDTWEKSTIVDFPVDQYVIDSGLPDTGEDIDDDGIFQEFFNSDGSGNVLVDMNGDVHVFFGEMYYTDSDLTDGNFQYFPGTNGLAYWNQTMGEDSTQTIAYTYDIDGSGTLDFEEDIALYFVSVSGMPSSGVDAANNIYVSYSALMESNTNGSQNYRHLYVINSTDGGATWNTESACNLTPDEADDGYENVFASMAPMVDDHIHMIFQRDFEPGLAVRGDEDPYDNNDIMYFQVPVDELGDCDEIIYDEIIGVDEIIDEDVSIYPNPANEELFVVLDVQAEALITLYDLAGKTVQTFNSYQMINVVDVSNLQRGMYLLEVNVNGSKVVERVSLR